MNMQWSMMPPTLYASWVPMWIEILITLLLVAGGIITLIGSLGLLRMNDFFQRLHGPAMGNTLGSICILLGSLLFFSFSRQRLVFHEVLILLFVLLTAPVVGMLLARAALYRKQGAALSAQVKARAGEPGSAE
ncbi:MAG: monovalent cation/H(+) antiporter subunit G, partial [Burkholderiaceae bacterium]